MRGWGIGVAVLGLVACSARGDGGDVATHDAGPGHDGATDMSMSGDGAPVDAGVDTGSGDAGATDAGHDAGSMDAGRDAGSMDAGHDAGTDAGSRDAGVDLPTELDLGPAPLNDTCTSAIDVTAGGTVTGTTCGADDTLTLGLGPPGCDTPVTPLTPDVFYHIDASSPGTHMYRLVITPGYAIQFVPSVCDGNGGCGPYRSSMDFTIGGSGSWYFAVEKSGGGCGTFSLTVSTF